MLFPTISSLTYYFDSLNGLDSNSGLLTSLPKKTLNSVTITNQVKEIYLKRDSVWDLEGFDLINLNGIKVSDYGEGNKNPLLNGGIEINEEWILDSNGVYYVDLSNVIESNRIVKMVFVDKEVYTIAQVPSNEKNDYFYINENTNDYDGLRCKDNFNLSYSDIVGSRAFIRIKRYELWTSEVVDFDEGLKSIYIENELPHDWMFCKGCGFKLTNKKWMLFSNGNNGSWFFDNSTKLLYIRMKDDSSNPNDFKIEIAYKTNGIFIKNSSDVIIENLSFNSFLDYGIFAGERYDTVNNVIIQNCTFRYIRLAGIRFYCSYSKNVTLFNNTIMDITYVGISVHGLHLTFPERLSCRNFTVKRNIVNRIMIEPFSVILLKNYLSQDFGAGIRVKGEGALVTENSISFTGYSSMEVVSFHERSIIHKNYVKHSCLILDDGGGLHTGRSIGHIISNNLMVDILGNAYGTSNYPSKLNKHDCYGIYLDFLSGNSTIFNNTVINARIGINVGHSVNNDIKDNTILFARDNGILVTSFTQYGHLYYVKNNTITSNIFHSDSSFNNPQGEIARVNVNYQTEYFNLSDIAFFDKNYYFAYSPYLFYTNNYDTGINKIYLSFEEWNQIGFDLNGKMIGKEWYEYEKIHLKNYSNINMVYNGNFSTSIDGWSLGSPKNNCDSNLGYIITKWNEDFKCLETVITDVVEVCPGNVFTKSTVDFVIEKGKQYMFGADLFSSQFSFIRIQVRGSSGISLDKTVLVTEKRERFEFLFNVDLDTSDDGYIFFKPNIGSTLLTTYYIANVSLHEVFNGKIRNNPENDVIYFLNTDFDEKRIITLDKYEKYCDIDGNIIENDIELDPLSSIVLVQCFCNNDGSCNNYENSNSCPDECDPVCGNLVCEYGEDYSNCPSDCISDDQNEDYTVIIVIISIVLFLFISGLLILIIFLIIKRKHNKLEKKKIFDDENTNMMIELNSI